MWWQAQEHYSFPSGGVDHLQVQVALVSIEDREQGALPHNML